MSVTIGISVRDAVTKNELSAKMKKIPGETDQARLEYCLNTVLSTQSVTGSHQEILKSVRDSQNHTLDIILAELEKNDILYEQNISDRQKSIASLSHELDDSREVNITLNKKIAELEAENTALRNQIENLREQLSDSEGLRKVLQAQLDQSNNASVATAGADIIAQLKEIIKDFRSPEKQITMFDIVKE